MPLLCPPPETAEVRWLTEPEQDQNGHSPEAQVIRSQLTEALRQLRDRSGKVEGSAPEEERYAYRHVPIRIVSKIKVRYKPARALKPRRFPTEDEV
jgi:hypothetical protein